MTIGAFCIILDGEGRVLLCRRWDHDVWNLPGGGADTGEAPWAAAVREAREEVGVEVVIDRLAAVDFKHDREEIVFTFVARITRGEPTTSDEAREVGYFAVGTLPANTLPRHASRLADFFADPAALRMRG